MDEDYAHFYVANQLLSEWIIGTIKLDADSSPQNESLYSSFSTAAHTIDQQDGDVSSSDFRVNDPKFVTKTTLHRHFRDIHQINENYSELLEMVDVDVIMSEISFPASFRGIDTNEDKFRMAIEGYIHDDLIVVHAKSFYEIHLANYLLPFVTISQALIEEYSIEILNNELIAENYQGTNTTTKLLDDFSQYEREQLLQRTEILDGATIGKMGELRNIRNELVHDMRSDEYFELVRGSENAVNNAARAIDALSEMLDEVEIFESENI